jgi:hypothetical protein
MFRFTIRDLLWLASSRRFKVNRAKVAQFLHPREVAQRSNGNCPIPEQPQAFRCAGNGLLLSWQPNCFSCRYLRFSYCVAKSDNAV